MALSPTNLPIFPGLKPGQSYTMPSSPVKGAAGWNFKETMSWNNFKQQSVNGRVIAVKYWVNPKWAWEWTYGVIKDRPYEPNPFYTVPIPSTDFEILKSFYAGMQGGGNEFAYQPFDSVRGGTFTSSTISALTANIAVIKTNGSVSLARVRLGDKARCSGFGTATYINSQLGTVISFDADNNLITLSINTTGTHAQVSDTGSILIGQPLSNPDSNNNTELVHTIGSYPLTISPTPTVKLVTESIQLVDPSTGFAVYDSTGTNLGGNYSLLAPGTTSPYAGFVIAFGGFSSFTPPLFCTHTYCYPCRFSEDTQEYENFITMLWSCSSLKFEQVKI